MNDRMKDILESDFQTYTPHQNLTDLNHRGLVYQKQYLVIHLNSDNDNIHYISDFYNIYLRKLMKKDGNIDFEDYKIYFKIETLNDKNEVLDTVWIKDIMSGCSGANYRPEVIIEFAGC
jgi:hypothetical protein